jgi:hypothetical protein
MNDHTRLWGKTENQAETRLAEAVTNLLEACKNYLEWSSGEGPANSGAQLVVAMRVAIDKVEPPSTTQLEMKQ